MKRPPQSPKKNRMPPPRKRAKHPASQEGVPAMTAESAVKKPPEGGWRLLDVLVPETMRRHDLDACTVLGFELFVERTQMIVIG